MTTWNLFILLNEAAKIVIGDVTYVIVLLLLFYLCYVMSSTSKFYNQYNCSSDYRDVHALMRIASYLAVITVRMMIIARMLNFQMAAPRFVKWFTRN